MFSKSEKNSTLYPSTMAGHERWNRMLKAFCNIAQSSPVDDRRMIYILANSPESPAAAKILSNIVALREEGITVAALFREVPKRGLSKKLIMDVVENFGIEYLKKYVRLLPDYGDDSPKGFVRLGRTGFHYGAQFNLKAIPLNDESTIDIRNRPEIAHTSYLAFQTYWAESLILKPSLISFFNTPPRTAKAKETEKNSKIPHARTIETKIALLTT